MKALAIGVCLFLLLPSAIFAKPTDIEVLTVARSFATQLDSGDFQAAYRSASPLMRLLNDEQEWLNDASRTRQVLGKVTKRELRRIRAVDSPSEMPDDDYRLLLFDTSTEHKKSAAEVVTLHKVDGDWKVCAYSLR